MKEHQPIVETLVPPQAQGRKLDTEHTIIAGSDKEAKDIFERAVFRLLNVNQWQQLCSPLSSEFKLVDKKGYEVTRLAQPGDYVKIDVPGPGPVSGKGFDWVKIESMEDYRDRQGEVEEVGFKVRPVSNPKNPIPGTAHFFRDSATSSFIVERNGNQVTAGVHSRNEVPNTAVRNGADKFRNVVMAMGAISGLSRIQWNLLVKGLLESSLRLSHEG